MNFQCLYDIAEPIHTELEQMRKEKSFTDVCLILNDSRGMERRIYAHRVILASAIPYVCLFLYLLYLLSFKPLNRVFFSYL